MTIDRYYDVSKSRWISIPFMTNKEAFNEYQKGWGYSYVYSLVEIRDIYLTLKQYGINSISHFTENYVMDKVPFAKMKWNKRRVLEVLNSMINFDLIDKEYHILNPEIFSNSIVGTPLSESDKIIFKGIYFNYFRFRELLVLYMNPAFLGNDRDEIQKITEYQLVNNSTVLYSFMTGGHYVNSFFTRLEDNPLIYTIPNINEDGDKNSAVMRFWDVFISWGENLGVLEKFNMTSVGSKLSNNKSFVCSYILSKKQISISLIEYIRKAFPNKRSIDLCQLVFQLCIDFRVSHLEAKDYIISEYKNNMEQISLVRTSEIFIKEKEFTLREKIFFPKYKDSYISHLIIRT